MASEPAIASSTTWTPLSAPICSALRTASTAFSGPTRERGHRRPRPRRPSPSAAAPARRRTRRARTAARRRRRGRRCCRTRTAGRRWRRARTSHRRRCSWWLAWTVTSCALELHAVRRGSSHRSTRGGIVISVRGWLDGSRVGSARSRIRPTTSQATAPRPQLNRAFLVVGVLAGELLDAVVAGEDPEVDACRRPSSTNFDEGVVRVGVQRDQQRADGQEQRGEQAQQPDQLGQHHAHLVTVAAPRSADPIVPDASAVRWSSRPSSVPHASATLELGLARTVLDERSHADACGPRWRTAPRTAGARSPARCRGRSRGRGRWTPSRPAGRTAPRRRTGAAQASASSYTCSAGTTRSTRPIASASSALTNRPVKMRSLARLGPTSRVSRWVPPAPGMIPSRISGWPSTASSAANRTSAHSASSQPPPSA